MTKPLHVGHSARDGLLATLLTAEGFTANPGALEHPQGFLRVFNGAGNFEADAILRDWGQPWDIVQPGVAIKQYPCCGSTHPAIDAMLSMVREHHLSPAMVRRVDSWTHPRRLAHTNRPEPNSELDAKFSVQYCLARALADGRVSLEHFEGGSFREAAIRELLPRIHAAPHPDMSMASSEHFGAEVRVTLTDGRVLTAKVARPLGRGPENPLPTELLEAKFLDCAMRALSMEQADSLLANLRELDALSDMRRVTDAMIPSAALAAD
jgi:2-methylcitrate dehydratase PrpD